MTRRFVYDLLERAGATFVQAFLALVLAGWGDIAGLDDLVTLGRAAAVAALAAGLSVIKAGLARFTGDRNDASLVQ